MAASQPNVSSLGGQIKPTLLSFHGSGSNAMIHTIQLARFNKVLKPHFNIESLEGPYPSAAGPGVLPFFEGCGPYKRWLPPQEKYSVEALKRGEASGSLPPEVEHLVRSKIAEIQSKGGKVVGLIGFSQGTRVVAGLLKGTEIRRALAPSRDSKELDWLDFDFAISAGGSYPPALVPQAATEALAKSSIPAAEQDKLVKSKIVIPTFHIQGTQDEWAWAGEILIEQAYDVEAGQGQVEHFNIGHHYPVEPEDTEKVTDWVLDTWQRTAEERENR